MTDEQNHSKASHETIDQHLRGLGMEPRVAWVRSDETGKAARNRRHREKAQRQGKRQISVMVPDDHREAVKNLCKELCSRDSNGPDLMAAMTQGSGQELTGGRSAAARPPRAFAFKSARATKQVLKLIGTTIISFVAGVLTAVAFY